MTWNVLNLVRRTAGDEGVRSLLERAGLRRSEALLADDAAWISFHEARALLEAASEVLGDPGALRRVGEAILRRDMTSEVVELLRSLGSVGEILRHIDRVVPKFCTVVHMVASEVGPLHALVDATSVDGFDRFPLLCDLTSGVLSQTPIPFGLPAADVREVLCESRGDDRCRFEVRWQPIPSPHVESRLAALEGEFDVLAARFETFQQTAADLVAVADVATALDSIANRAGLAVRAPRHLLAVSPTPGAPLLVHQVGCDPREVDGLVAELMAEPPDDHGGSRLIVDVVSARRTYGRLAAIFDDGAHFFEAERALLESYSRLAAAALDTAMALEEARQQAVTAETLLALARQLSGTEDRAAMARHVAAAVTAVLPCDSACVLLRDEATGRLQVVAIDGSDQVAAALVRPAAAAIGVPPLATIGDARSSRSRRVGIDDPFVARLLDATGAEAAVVAPLIAGESLLGAVVACASDAMAAELSATSRLDGIADIAATALRNAELVQEMREQALHDAVTGLPNKRLLEDRVAYAFTDQRRRGGGFALLFLDLDRFKNVNDTLGHAAGDELLGLVGERLRSCAREQDTVARLGGDEFAVLLRDVDGMDAADAFTRRLRDVLQAPFTIAGQQLFVTASIGVVHAPEHGLDYDTLLRHADAAMYESKRAGRNRFAHFTTPSRVGPEPLRLEYDLHRAVERDELFLEYQPLVSLPDRRICGVEALVRWQHPELGRLDPDQFIPLAEESHLITSVDAWVLAEAVRQAAAWSALGLDLRMAVNVGDRDLRHGALVERVEALLARFDVSPQALEIEVSERVVDEEGDELLEVLLALRGIGVRTAIDDFGTGQSGLRRLMRLPVDSLKIDRAFLRDVTDADGTAPVLTTMIRLAHELGMSALAEGVETERQAAFLERQGCDESQGYHFAKPLPADAALELLLDWPSAPVAGAAGG